MSLRILDPVSAFREGLRMRLCPTIDQLHVHSTYSNRKATVAQDDDHVGHQIMQVILVTKTRTMMSSACMTCAHYYNWPNHLGVYSALPKNVSRCRLKVFPPEVYTASSGGDVKPLVPGDLV